MASCRMRVRFACFLLCFCSQLSLGSKVPALFIFGDSTLDTGNLKHVSASSLIMSNSLPYGRDLVPPHATGRASNGKLATDFLAEYLQLPTPPSSHDASSPMLRGRNFATGGSGFLNSTGLLLGTISFSEQLDLFEGSLTEFSKIVQPQSVAEYLAKSLFVVSTGNNDLLSYLFNPAVRFQYDTKSYNEYVLKTAASHLQRLYHLGARKMLVLSVGPLGCTPAVLSLYNSNGECIKPVNEQVEGFNSGLQGILSAMRTSLGGIKLSYGNAYEILKRVIQNPSKYGFKYGNVACCGLGRFRGSTTCGNYTVVCSSSDEHVFWDLVHPTQAMYRITAEKLTAGPQSIIYPMSIDQLIAS